MESEGCVSKCTPIDPTLPQPNLVHILTPCLINIQFNVIFLDYLILKLHYFTFKCML
jgi:hypothetical protein